jgi:hypothetical protein
MAARVYSLLSAAHLMNLPLMSHFNYKSSYHRNLPHIQPPGATLFVTFRLAGSLPQSIIEQWQKKRRCVTSLKPILLITNELKPILKEHGLQSLKRYLTALASARFG